jgi:hypothetical protein
MAVVGRRRGWGGGETRRVDKIDSPGSCLRLFHRKSHSAPQTLEREGAQMWLRCTLYLTRECKHVEMQKAFRNPHVCATSARKAWTPQDPCSFRDCHTHPKSSMVQSGHSEKIKADVKERQSEAVPNPELGQKILPQQQMALRLPMKRVGTDSSQLLQYVQDPPTKTIDHCGSGTRALWITSYESRGRKL